MLPNICSSKADNTNTEKAYNSNSKLTSTEPSNKVGWQAKFSPLVDSLQPLHKNFKIYA